MLGNAAEWVTDTGEKNTLRGGHYGVAVIDFGPDWRAVEDPQVWSQAYPQWPQSEHFFWDFPYAGIRLALDEDQAPRNSEAESP